MAILVEAISVVVRRDAVDSRYPGGWSAFALNAPDQTLCADANLVRVGFMQPSDAQRFVERLESCGINYVREGAAQDLVVVDQQSGLLAPCAWLEFGHVSIGPGGTNRVAAVRMAGDTDLRVITPDGWAFDGSLSQTFGFVPAGQIDKSLRFLRHQDGVDVYYNEMTGQEVYVAGAKRDR